MAPKIGAMKPRNPKQRQRGGLVMTGTIGSWRGF
jgi:hypothetical protein